jgi:hypothetical protein
VPVKDGERDDGCRDAVGDADGRRDVDADVLPVLLALGVTVPLAEGEELAPTDRDAVADGDELALSDPLADAVTLDDGEPEGVGLAEAYAGNTAACQSAETPPVLFQDQANAPAAHDAPLPSCMPPAAVLMALAFVIQPRSSVGSTQPLPASPMSVGLPTTSVCNGTP